MKTAYGAGPGSPTPHSGHKQRSFHFKTHQRPFEFPSPKAFALPARGHFLFLKLHFYRRRVGLNCRLAGGSVDGRASQPVRPSPPPPPRPVHGKDGAGDAARRALTDRRRRLRLLRMIVRACVGPGRWR